MATTKKLKHSEIEAKDRLSDLPESVILHMLSFLNAKHAVQTCVLSTRWKNLWKLLPVLIFNFTDFQFYKKFMNFIFKVLSLRNSSVTLQALEYKRDGGQIDPRLLKNIVNYAISHNVQRLGLCSYTKISQIPPRMFSCQSLTHLKLCTYPRKGPETMFPNSFNLPALISLQLQHFVFCLGDNNCAEPFSTFNKLNSLLISNCYLSGEGTLCISNVTLVDLTLYNEFYRFYTIELCTPSLCTFSFDGTPSQKLLGSNVSSLEHVEIYAEVIPHQEEPPLILFNWLLEFPNIKSLTVSTTTLQVPCFEAIFYFLLKIPFYLIIFVFYKNIN